MMGTSPRNQDDLKSSIVKTQNINNNAQNKESAVFRISTLTKPHVYKEQPLFERLKEPKKVYEPKQPFI